MIKLEGLTPVDTQFVNRIAWVRTYLYKAGLINQVSKGFYHNGNSDKIRFSH
uniref:winged helix-turn-helix domain-containing protein n=1 Tax=Algoriphagus sp. TaxID=1872435 RepID=UPI0040472691